MDQSNRYANLSLREEDLMAGGKHVLCAYIMKPKAGFGSYLATAAHFAAESSTGTNVSVSTTDDFTRGVDALVYEIDEKKEIMKIAYPTDLFDRNIIDGRAMLASFLTLTIGNNQGMGDVEYAKMYDFWMPPEYLRLYDGPSTDISDLWRVLGRPVVDGGFIVGTIIKPSSSPNWVCGPSRLPRQPMSSGEAEISSKTTNPRVTRSLPASRKPSLPSPIRCVGPRMTPGKPSCFPPTSRPMTTVKSSRAGNSSWRRLPKTPTTSHSWSMDTSPDPRPLLQPGVIFPSSTCTTTGPATAP